VVIRYTLATLPIHEGKYVGAALLGIAIRNEVAGQGINAQFDLRDPAAVWGRSHGDSANIAFLVNPFSLEWPVPKKAIGAQADETHHGPIAELQVTAALDEHSIDKRGHSTSRIIGIGSSQLMRFS
jgi:hypothetical protein